jgi:hypothetical protein
MKTNKEGWWRCFETASRENHRRFSISSTRSSMSNILQITSGQFLRELGLSYAKPRPKRPHRPENPEDILDEDHSLHNRGEGDDEEGWVIDDIFVQMAERFWGFRCVTATAVR